MITLYGFGPAFKLPDPSPFVIKADLLLKLSGQPYETHWNPDPRKAPKHKLPYIIDDDQPIADSTMIRWHLEKKYHIDFDAGLTPEQRAIAWSLQIMAEDHLYWAMVDMRWNDDANFAAGPKKIFGGLPPILRTLVANSIRANVIKRLDGHGMGRHSKIEIAVLADHDFSAMAAILGDKPYFFGDTPTGVDAVMFSFFSCCLCSRFTGPLVETAKKYPTLKAYAARMAARFYPDITGFGGFV